MAYRKQEKIEYQLKHNRATLIKRIKDATLPFVGSEGEHLDILNDAIEFAYNQELLEQYNTRLYKENKELIDNMRALLLAIYDLEEKEKKDLMDRDEKVYGLTFTDKELDDIVNYDDIPF